MGTFRACGSSEALAAGIMDLIVDIGLTFVLSACAVYLALLSVAFVFACCRRSGRGWFPYRFFLRFARFVPFAAEFDDPRELYQSGWAFGGPFTPPPFASC